MGWGTRKAELAAALYERLMAFVVLCSPARSINAEFPNFAQWHNKLLERPSVVKMQEDKAAAQSRQ